MIRKPTKRIRRNPRLAILVVSAVTACAIGQAQPSTIQQADQLARSGHTEEAVRLLQDTLAARPADLDVRLALATVLAREHKYKEAQATIALLPAPKDANERVRYFRLVASIDSGLGDSRGCSPRHRKRPASDPHGRRNCNVSRHSPKQKRANGQPASETLPLCTNKIPIHRWGSSCCGQNWPVT